MSADVADVRLSVSHETTYRYSMPVETAQHLATIRPLDCPWQRVMSYRWRIDPSPSYETSHVDAFGNEVRYFSFDAPHGSLQVTSETTVELTRRWGSLVPSATPAWDGVADALRYRAVGTYMPESEFVFASPNISLAPELREYALPSFPPGRPLVAGAIDLMHRIHADFAYKPQTTSFDTPALRAFRLRQGVCQDFAQVMIGALRSLGLAARYVSGYLRTVRPEGTPNLVGADASHAWVSVYCPGTGWVDLDPTNDVLADLDHVTLAVGRDYGDVSLLRGIILGGGEHVVDVAVNVTAV
ncbi:transglutaminase family protein [Trinickia dinghuensis]|uniref:Transglutaminase family protein n=1 Tax=Trinickia dinghuensis TaxID=2291023 RepID=A0A3D8JSS7_9BURK|nr:transglutaminase family protein [Trinickia dinghuensis]RDU95726.1 transglutaminase family protein [Trinickia dinghuensis]